MLPNRPSLKSGLSTLKGKEIQPASGHGSGDFPIIPH